MGNQNVVSVSIVIKALNEEKYIGACLTSAIAALKDMGGEVILADSGSTDKTIEIAAQYPIKIVQLAHLSERRCGIGVQLGYQFARGKYVYVLDGDMELEPGFLEQAIAALEQGPQLAGVAGLVDEYSDGSVQFRGRRARNFEGTPGIIDWLDMGGLYRRAALESVDYISNRNLFAHEEKELGLRLVAKGWMLERLPVKGIRHHGHIEPTLPLLRKRWRSGYLFGAGQIIRSSIGAPYFARVVWGHKHLLMTLALYAWLITGLIALPQNTEILWTWGAAIVAVSLQRVIRHRNVQDGLLCVLVWHVNAVGLVRGLFLKQVDPRLPVEARVVFDAVE